jgi:hypothetical protein
VSGCSLACDGDAPGSDREASGRERAGWPARYEVRVQGVLDGRWSQWLGACRSALHGVLDKVFDLGLAVIAVRRLPPEELGGERR